MILYTGFKSIENKISKIITLEKKNGFKLSSENIQTMTDLFGVFFLQSLCIT